MPTTGALTIVDSKNSKTLPIRQAPDSLRPISLLKNWFYALPETHRPLFDRTVGFDPNLDEVCSFAIMTSGEPTALVFSYPEYRDRNPDKNRVWHLPFFKPGLPADEAARSFQDILERFPGRVQRVYRQTWDRSKGEELKAILGLIGFECIEEIWRYEVTPETYDNQRLLREMDDGLTFEIVDSNQEAFIDSLEDPAFRSWCSFYQMEGHTPDSAICGVAREGGRVVAMDWVMMADACTDAMFDGAADWRKNLTPKGGMFRSAWAAPEHRGQRAINRICELLAERLFGELGFQRLASETSSLNIPAQKPNERYGMKVTETARYNLFSRDDSA